MTTIEALAHGRDNNFNLLRMIAASAVLVSHAYPLTLGKGTPEPLSGIAPMDLGRMAVAIFFVISGFFITKSFDRRYSSIAFVTDRVLRIYPGLLVVLALTVLVLGPLFTELGLKDYFSTRATWTYLPKDLLLHPLQYTLPGVFERNPGNAINGSLWTLWWEVMCYAMVVIVGLLSTLLKRRFAIALLVYALVYGVYRFSFPAAGVPEALELSLPFVIGMTFYVFRDRVKLHFMILLILIALVVAVRGSPVYREAFVLMIAYSSFYFGYLPWMWLRRYNRLGDYSYGMYIYAFPVEQMIVAVAPGIPPGQMMALALPVTLIFAIGSWMLVESPALDQRHYIGRELTSRFMRRPAHDAVD